MRSVFCKPGVAACRLRCANGNALGEVYNRFEALTNMQPLPSLIVAKRGGAAMVKARGLIRFTLIALAAACVNAPAQAQDGITKDRILIGQAAGFTGSVAGAVKEQNAGAKA